MGIYSLEEKEAIEKLKETQDSYLKDELDLAIEVVLNLIQKQEKIIDKMTEHIYKGCDFDNRIKTKEQILEYFKKEVEKEC